MEERHGGKEFLERETGVGKLIEVHDQKQELVF